MIPKQPSIGSSRKSIAFSSKESPKHSLEDVAPIEYDIDERVIRSSTTHLQALDNPVSASVDNSKIFEVLEDGFPFDLPQDLHWPEFSLMTPGECVEYLGEVISCRNHDENLVSFWILDTLSEIIWQGQVCSLTDEQLSTTCLWFGHALKTISVYAPSREDFFEELNRMLFQAEEEFLETGYLLKPNETLERIEENKLNEDGLMMGAMSLPELTLKADTIDLTSESDVSSPSQANITLGDGGGDAPSSKSSLQTNSSSSCDSFNVVNFLSQHMFKTFGNRFKYEVIKSVFSNAPEVQPLVIVENMNFPKEMGLSQKHIQELNQKRREVKDKTGSKAPTRKGGKKTRAEKEPPVNLAVEKFKNQLIQLDWNRLDNLEKLRTQDLYIKPLEDSVDSQFFERLFPRHESLLPQTNITETTNNKGKGKKKK